MQKVEQMKRADLNTKYIAAMAQIESMQKQIAEKGNVQVYDIFTRLVAPGLALAGAVACLSAMYKNPNLLVNGLSLLNRNLGSSISLENANNVLGGKAVELFAGLAGGVSYAAAYYIVTPVVYGVLKLISVITDMAKKGFTLHPYLVAALLAFLLAYYVGALETGIKLAGETFKIS